MQMEKNSLNRQFEELVITLIAMTLPVKLQKNYYGIGFAGDEMAIDFETYYTLNRSQFVESNLIDKAAAEALDEIDNLLDFWTDEKEESFWFEIDQYQSDWDVLRNKANQTLKVLEKDHLTIDFQHEVQYNKYGEITSQFTKVELKEK